MTKRSRNHSKRTNLIAEYSQVTPGPPRRRMRAQMSRF
jgi:hypothetical protein